VRAIASISSYLKSYVTWVSHWRCLPVHSWIRGAQFFQRGDFQRAADCYMNGLRSHPTSRARVNALLDLSHCLFRLQQFDQAEVFLRQVTAAFPNLRDGYIRLARLQLWLGYSSEAIWTMRLCLQRISVDPEILTLFINAVVDSGADTAAVQEAQALLKRVHYDALGFPALEVARARLELVGSASDYSREDISRLAALNKGPFDAVVAFAEVLLSEGKIAYARHHLHRALLVAPEHPKVLRLLAFSYLHEGAFYEPLYAVQLALKACQVTAWRGIQELYILAQAYVAQEDKAAALMVALQAKKIAARLIGGHPGVEKLERYLQGVGGDVSGGNPGLG
jgi:tetratricopeptide (TPR) repeat protein